MRDARLENFRYTEPGGLGQEFHLLLIFAIETRVDTHGCTVRQSEYYDVILDCMTSYVNNEFHEVGNLRQHGGDPRTHGLEVLPSDPPRATSAPRDGWDRSSTPLPPSRQRRC